MCIRDRGDSDGCEVVASECGGCEVGLFYFARLGNEELITWLVNHGVRIPSINCHVYKNDVVLNKV